MSVLLVLGVSMVVLHRANARGFVFWGEAA